MFALAAGAQSGGLQQEERRLKEERTLLEQELALAQQRVRAASEAARAARLANAGVQREVVSGGGVSYTVATSMGVQDGVALRYQG